MRCQYWHSKKQTWRIKSKFVEFDSDMDVDQKEELVHREAEALQRFFLANHNLDNNLPGGDGSAESVIEEPMRKAPRGD